MNQLFKVLLSICMMFSIVSATNDKPTPEEVSKLYVATFNRAPDSAGLLYWVNTGDSLLKIASDFFLNPETQELYPQGTSDESFINSVYQNLFNRAPDNAGLDYWKEDLKKPGHKREEFILLVIGGAKDNADGLDRTILDNKNEVGLYFANAGLGNDNYPTEVMRGVTASRDTVSFIKNKIDTREIYSSIWFQYNVDDSPIEITSALEYINQFRQQAGLVLLQKNTYLTNASQNHSNYLYTNNTTGHNESNGFSGYTGYDAPSRAVYVGYSGRSVFENVSNGQSNVYGSIDSLMAAIYHRFIFLNNSIDEIGIGIKENIYTYNMSNSLIASLCDGDSFSSSGRYYYNICSDASFKIEVGTYDFNNDYYANLSPTSVIWPVNNAVDIPPAFFEETPDPLPDASVSGYPISIEFNSKYINSIFVISFEIYDARTNEMINNTRLIDENSDVNHRFNKLQFALFPMDRLKWNNEYRVKFDYVVNDNAIQSESWSFKTRSLDYASYTIPKNSYNETFHVNSGVTYAFYFEPVDKNDIASSYSMSYDYGISLGDKGYIDSNTLYFTISGQSGKSATITLSNSKKITLVIAN